MKTLTKKGNWKHKIMFAVMATAAVVTLDPVGFEKASASVGMYVIAAKDPSICDHSVPFIYAMPPVVRQS